MKELILTQGDKAVIDDDDYYESVNIAARTYYGEFAKVNELPAT